jgi:hypothetical protein
VHLTSSQELALEVARELAMGDSSPAHERADREWEERGGDVINTEAIERWKDAPADEVRARLSSVSGELRGYLTVVPETRWIKNAERREFFLSETLDHYEDHLGDLRAILAAAGR